MRRSGFPHAICGGRLPDPRSASGTARSWPPLRRSTRIGSPAAGRLARDRANRRRVVILHAAAQQHTSAAARSASPRTARGRFMIASSSPRGAVESGAVRQHAGRVDRRVGAAACASGRPHRSSRTRTRAGPSGRDSSRTSGWRDAAPIASRIVSGLPVWSFFSMQRRDVGRRRRRRRPQHVLHASTCRAGPARSGARTTSR